MRAALIPFTDANFYTYYAFLASGVLAMALVVTSCDIWRLRKKVFLVLAFIAPYVYVDNLRGTSSSVGSASFLRAKSERPKLINYEGQVNSSVNIPHSSLDSYEGPHVEGWPPNRTRDMRAYVKPFQPTVLLDFDDCTLDYNSSVSRQLGHHWKADTRLFIMQHSHPDNFIARMDNRRTWMHFAKESPSVTVVFLVGLSDSAGQQKRLMKEQSLYCDLIQVNVADHLNNSTIKAMLGLKYVLNVGWIEYPEFVMKVEDTSYVNIPLLEAAIFDTPNYKPRKGIGGDSANFKWPPIIGSILMREKVKKLSQSKRFMVDTFADPLVCPPYFYNRLMYPSFALGAGYLMPWWSLSCLYQEGLKLPYFFIEDVFVTGFAADRCLLPRKNIEGFVVAAPHVTLAAELNLDQTYVVAKADHNLKHDVHKLMTTE